MPIYRNIVISIYRRLLREKEMKCKKEPRASFMTHGSSKEYLRVVAESVGLGLLHEHLLAIDDVDSLGWVADASSREVKDVVGGRFCHSRLDIVDGGDHISSE